MGWWVRGLAGRLVDWLVGWLVGGWVGGSVSRSVMFFVLGFWLRGFCVVVGSLLAALLSRSVGRPASSASQQFGCLLAASQPISQFGCLLGCTPKPVHLWNDPEASRGVRLPVEKLASHKGPSIVVAAAAT